MIKSIRIKYKDFSSVLSQIQLNKPKSLLGFGIITSIIDQMEVSSHMKGLYRDLAHENKRILTALASGLQRKFPHFSIYTTRIEHVAHKSLLSPVSYSFYLQTDSYSNYSSKNIQ